MDPPAMMNGEVYNLPEICQFPVNGVGGRDGFGMGMGLGRFGDLNRVGGPGGDDYELGSRKRKGLELEEEDDPFKGGVPSSNGQGNGLSDGNNSDAKRIKATGNQVGDECPDGGAGAAPEPGSGKNAERKANGAPEPPKQDYIHVRARRGQATDSHSLAERARREKISERMKILQDLVPGCNKVIGKALVLDEIINYIQSLQRQVEFLSMKLEAINTRMNPEIEVFPSKDFGHQTFDPASMAFASQAAREFSRGPSPEWLHMQVGGGFERTS